MIRELLADRFKLVMRVENRAMPVYALTLASGGPKLPKSVRSDNRQEEILPVYTVEHLERPAGN